MASRRLYLLAILFLATPLLFRLGYGVIRQDVVDQCARCSSMHYTSERHRNIWGVSGKQVLRDEIVASRVKADFPELPCDHAWVLVSDKRGEIINSPLFIASPGERLRWLPANAPLASRYDQDSRLRKAVKAALERGAVSRQQMADWLADKEPQALSPAAKAEFEALAKAFW
jgi:hypothetical protein